jgi:hypothetical protein
VSRVLFVDTWSHGRFFTDEVSEEISKHSDVFFLHADELYGIDKEYSKGNKNLTVYDLAKYKMSFFEALEDIKPDVVIFISMHGIFHRWLNLICEIREIKTLFYMHGVRFVRSEGAAAIPTNNKSISQKVSRGVFYLKHWYLLLKDLYFSKQHICSDSRLISVLIKSFCEMFIKNHRFSDNPKYKWGLKFETLCINTKYDQLYFENFVGQTNVNKLVVSGHLTSRRAAIESFNLQSVKRQYALFISQPLISASYIEAKLYFDILLFLKNRIENETDLEFIVRPHPRDDADFISKLKSSNFSFSNSEEFSTDLAHTQLVLGFNSSALLGCMDMGLPVAVIALKGIPLLEALTKYVHSIELEFNTEMNNNFPHFTDWLNDMLKINIEQKHIESSEEIISKEVLLLL